MKKSVYIETSIPSYLTARPSRDVLVSSCQQITLQWWDEYRMNYNLFTSELVTSEASYGDLQAAKRRLEVLDHIDLLPIDEEVETLANQMIETGAIPSSAKADAIHIAVAAVQKIDYLLTWNCRHINSPSRKPMIRKVCTENGYCSPEICTPLELIEEEPTDV